MQAQPSPSRPVTTSVPLACPHPCTVVNILTLIFLLRFWPVPGGRSPLGGVEPITVQVRICFLQARFGVSPASTHSHMMSWLASLAAAGS